MAELDEVTHAALLEAAAEGDAHAAAGRYRDAVVTYNKGWELIPAPKTDWEASTWILAAIADAAFRGRLFKSARQALDYAMRCPDAIGNAFLHLRRGQVLFEQGELDGAADELIRAYMAGGPELFDEEPAKYLEFLGTRAVLP